MDSGDPQRLQTATERDGDGSHAANGYCHTCGRVKKKLDTEGHVALYLNFDTDKATLRPDAQPALDQVLALLQATPALRLSVEGHTDSTGTPAHNQQLSAARAAAVAARLAQAGIAAGRLRTAGFGQARPLASNATEAGRAQNRRVELVKR